MLDTGCKNGVNAPWLRMISYGRTTRKVPSSEQYPCFHRAGEKAQGQRVSCHANYIANCSSF